MTKKNRTALWAMGILSLGTLTISIFTTVNVEKYSPVVNQKPLVVVVPQSSGMEDDFSSDTLIYECKKVVGLR